MEPTNAVRHPGYDDETETIDFGAIWDQVRSGLVLHVRGALPLYARSARDYFIGVGEGPGHGFAWHRVLPEVDLKRLTRNRMESAETFEVGKPADLWPVENTFPSGWEP